METKKSNVDVYVTDISKDEKQAISKIRLDNESGTVCSLSVTVKKTDGSEKHYGGSKKIAVKQSAEINLADLKDVNIEKEDWVTAYVDVVASAKDGNGNVWFKYDSSSPLEARFVIHGAIGLTTIAFCGFIKTE
ncbi:MAG: hypothetical protein LUC88_06665 [Prevotella sp.]|nr:hypothetical protein [Prevotella sp.]